MKTGSKQSRAIRFGAVTITHKLGNAYVHFVMKHDARTTQDRIVRDPLLQLQAEINAILKDIE